jgi:hypothetical protein
MSPMPHFYLAMAAILGRWAVSAHAQEAPAALADPGAKEDLAGSDSSLSYAYGHEYGYHAAPLYGHQVGYSHSYGHHYDDLGYGRLPAYSGVYGGVYAPYAAGYRVPVTGMNFLFAKPHNKTTLPTDAKSVAHLPYIC